MSDNYFHFSLIFHYRNKIKI